MAVEGNIHVLTSVAGVTAGILVLRAYDQWCISSFADCVAAGDPDDGERWARRLFVPWELFGLALLSFLLALALRSQTA